MAAELDGMMVRLDIPDAEVKSSCLCTGTAYLVAKYDADASGGLTLSEMKALIQGEPTLGKTIAAKLTNAPDPNAIGSMGRSLFSPDKDLLAATAKVTSSLKIRANKLFPGERKTIKAKFVEVYGTTDSKVIMRFVKVSVAAEANSGSRRRSLAATEWTVTSTGFLPDQAAADAAKSKAESTLGDKAAASTALGVTVTEGASVETSTVTGMAPMPWGSLALLAIVVVLAIATCPIASMCAKRNREKRGAESDSKCCVTGCCSYYATPTWAKLGAFAIHVFSSPASLRRQRVSMAHTCARLPPPCVPLPPSLMPFPLCDLQSLALWCSCSWRPSSSSSASPHSSPTSSASSPKSWSCRLSEVRREPSEALSQQLKSTRS